MSIGNTWLVQGRVLFFNVWGKINADELTLIDKIILTMLDSSQAPLVHSIYDFSKAEQIPSAKDLMKIKSGSHPRVGWQIIIGLDNKLMKFFVSAAGQIFGLRLRFMSTLEEAFAFLQDVDSTLPDLKSLDLAAAQARIHESAATLDRLSEAS